MRQICKWKSRIRVEGNMRRMEWGEGGAEHRNGKHFQIKIQYKTNDNSIIFLSVESREIHVYL